MWKKIPGFSRYEVTELGEIRLSPDVVKLRLTPGSLIRPHKCKQGYLHFTVCNDAGHYRRLSVHRAVALAFLGPQPPRCYALHGDDNPANNYLSNLRWGTGKQNGEDRVKNGGQARGEAAGNSRLTAAQVTQIRHIFAAEGRTLQYLAHKYHVGISTIHLIVTRRTWTYI